jgi:3-oxoacyl-[acyl-carrier protein] reductase
MDLQLTDKVALVTGASRGIGRATVRLLNEEGCRLAIVGRRKHILEEAADELVKSIGRRPLILAEDITDRDAPRRIKAAVLKTFGRLDILINNAGGSRPIKGGFGTPEEWEEGMRLNFDAGRNLAHAVVDSMQAQKFGRVINLTGTQEVERKGTRIEEQEKGVPKFRSCRSSGDRRVTLTDSMGDPAKPPFCLVVSLSLPR